ncbi:MAG: hypothetical protein R3307_07350 [Anaerolineales bacterium]|nr:hypothetical protein [Anaerolineales bacterium]
MENYIVLALLIGIAVLGIVFAIAAYKRRGEFRSEPDYRAFFILGISFLPIGIATENPGLWGMGAVFMILGAVNRNKWKDQPKWSELEPGRRSFKLIIIGLLTVLLMTALLLYLFAKAN